MSQNPSALYPLTIAAEWMLAPQSSLRSKPAPVFFFNGRTGRDAPQEIPKESWSKLMICDDHCKILMVGKHHNVVNPTINHPLLTRSD